MSLVTIDGLQMAPSAAAAISVVSGGSAYAYGAWVQAHAGVSGLASLAGIYVADPGASADCEVDVGVGLAGAEVSIGAIVRLRTQTGAGGTGHYMLPQPLNKNLIASGAAISLRIRSSSTSTTWKLGVLFYLDLDSDAFSTYLPTSVPTAATGVTVPTSGSAWTNGAWTQITAGLTDDAYVYGLTITPPGGAGSDYEVDLGTGGAGAEIVRTTFRGSSGTTNGRIKYLHLPALFLITGTTRIACRVRVSTTSATGAVITVLYYDGAPAVAPPSPAADYPCNIKTPVFWGALSVAGSGLLFAKKPLRDASTYYGGYKAPRLLAAGSVSRVASDWLTGSWSSQTASLKLADTDRYYRGLFQTARPDFLGSSAYLYLVSEATRLAAGAPTLVFRGPIYDDPVSEHLTYTVQVNDPISVAFNLFRGDPQIPQRFVTYDDFPSTPAINMGVPIIYGNVSDEGAGTPIGQIQAIPVGTLVIGGVTYTVGLISGHACAGGILNAYQNSAVLTTWGTDVWAPGKAGWSTIQPSGALYYDINGHRYTLIFLTGTKATDFASGSKPVYVNVNGTEPNGDGLGTVITDLFLQAKHLMLNYLTQSYQSGAYLTGSTFQFFPGGAATVPVVNETSFDTAKALAISQYLGSGFLGAFVIGANGARESVRNVLQSINICTNSMMTLDVNSSIKIVLLDRHRSTFIGSTRTLSDKRDVLSTPPFGITKNVNWFFNDIAYPFKATYRSDGVPTSSGDSTGPYQITAESQQDTASIGKYGRVNISVPLPFIRDTATADAVITQRLNFASTPPRIVTWSQSLCGMAFDVLSGVPMTNYGGLGPSGWTGNALWIIGQSLDPTTCRVTFTAVDVDHLLS